MVDRNHAKLFRLSKDCGQRFGRDRHHRRFANAAFIGVFGSDQFFDRTGSVIRSIQAKLLSPAAIKSLRAELGEQIKRQAKPRSAVDTKRLNSAIKKLDAKISRGAENLLLADPDNFATMQAMLNGWRRERDELAGKLPGQGTTTRTSDAKQLIDAAIAELYRLRERLADADKLTVRDAIKKTIDNVHIWWEPTEKRRCRVSKGVVELCGLLSSSRSGT